MSLVRICSSVVLAVGLFAASAFGQNNVIWVEDATGAAGGSATITVKLTSDTDVHALSLDLLFDQNSLQIKPLSTNSVVAGDDASGLDIPVLDDDLINTANSSGKLVIYMLHLNIDPEIPLNTISAGADKEILEVKFTVDSDAAVGDLTLDLANVSLVNVASDEDTLGTEIEVTAEAGTLTISQFQTGDASGDGKVDIFDVLAVLGALSGNPTVGPSDVNGDGKTDIFDVLAILKLL
ncbi:MAG: hypothetical protein FVQ81_14575 [Candidatus Glassbacteria bacterium]|nr:hypothetical protein [Candidatus Glassbacteria bacterium]